VYCLRMFYNQPNCCKGLKVCMNGRFFLANVAMNSAKTVGQKVGGSRLGEPRGPKKWGARAQRPNRSLRVWTEVTGTCGRLTPKMVIKQ